MEIRQLLYFVTIVEEGTISAAGRKLHLSQPPLSMQIKQLEEELGTVLFERGARQITLTETGQSLYRYAKEILELEHTAREDVKNYAQGRAGSVRIGVISTADSDELWNGLRLFHTRYPDIELLLYDANTMDLLEMIRHEKIELAFIRTPYPAHDFDAVPLRRDAFCAAGNPALLKGRGKIGLAELAACRLVTYRRREQIVRDALAAVNLAAPLSAVTDDARTALQLAEHGLGVALVPESLARSYRNLKKRRIDSDALTTQLNLIRRKDVLVSQGAKALFRIFSDSSSAKEAETASQ